MEAMLYFHVDGAAMNTSKPDNAGGREKVNRLRTKQKYKRMEIFIVMDPNIVIHQSKHALMASQGHRFILALCSQGHPVCLP